MSEQPHPPSRLHERGVSLTETLVVVTIIGLLVAIAIPKLLAARRASQEARAIANLRAVALAETMLYGSRQHFGAFEQLFRGDYLREGQFQRGAPGGGPRGSSAEALSDGVYLYTARFSRDALGVTIDADPIRANTGVYRRFRFRLGRRTRGGAWANEGLLLVAPPSVGSPPAAAYVPFEP